ncbi:5163_t:CDS:2, partial [Cetraspora pellucida]
VAKSSQTATIYTQYLKNIFSQISLWNIQKSRIEFWLCMDQIMLIESVILDDSELSKVESLKNAVIDWLWDELILNKEIDRGFVSKMIKGIREDVSIEISFCDALLNQIKKIQEDFPYDPNSMQFQFESQDNVYVSSIISRVKLLVLGAHTLTNRVTEVFTASAQANVRQNTEYILIEKLFVTLVNLLCDPRIHLNGGGSAHFDLILDLVSFLLDEMGKTARAVIVAELKQVSQQRHKIDNIPAIWSNRINRVLPIIFVQETIGEGKESHTIEPWKMIEGLGEDDDLTSSPIDLSWYNAK